MGVKQTQMDQAAVQEKLYVNRAGGGCAIHLWGWQHPGDPALGSVTQVLRWEGVFMAAQRALAPVWAWNPLLGAWPVEFLLGFDK